MKSYINQLFESSNEAKYLRQEFNLYEKAEAMMREIDDGDSKEWRTVMDNSNTKLKYKQEEGKSSFNFYAEKTMQMPVFNVARMYMGFPTWK